MPAWKASLRRKIWQAMEDAKGGTFSSPPFLGRLPSFRGEGFAWNRLTSLSEFETAQVIKIERTRREARGRTLLLELGKSLALTRLDLPDSFTSLLSKDDIPFHYTTEDASQRVPADAMARQVPLGEPVSLDLVLLPCLAVDPQSGAYIGLGNGDRGFGADLECGILKEMGAIHSKTKFVAVVHPLQLHDFKRRKMEKFDVPVDIVLTPWKTYYTQTELPRPSGVYWKLLKKEHFEEVSCLEELRKREAKK